MEKLTLTIEREVKFLVEYNLTADELLFIRTLLILQEESEDILSRDNCLDLFSTVLTQFKKNGVQPAIIIKNLQDKGIILKSWNIPKNGTSFDPFSIPLNKNFVKNLYRASFEIGKELYEAYPQFCTINGNVVGLRRVSNRFDTLEDFYFYYGKSINWNPEIHKHILDLIEWQNEHNLINYTISSFVIDRRYLELEALKNGDGANINYDAIRLI